ncbi:MAG: DUF3775 domain-containing protein [Glaciimonas sp.]|nr:DUF3775 domain-containing protein [Glaciimonas sp.]
MINYTHSFTKGATMEEGFKAKLKKLISLDAEFWVAERQRPNTTHLGSLEDSLVVIDILYSESLILPKVAQLLDTFTKDEIIRLQALFWYGRGDPIGDEKTFPPFLQYAQRAYHDQSRVALLGKEFSKYLTSAFERLGQSL